MACVAYSESQGRRKIPFVLHHEFTHICIATATATVFHICIQGRWGIIGDEVQGVEGFFEGYMGYAQHFTLERSVISMSSLLGDFDWCVYRPLMLTSYIDPNAMPAYAVTVPSNL